MPSSELSVYFVEKLQLFKEIRFRIGIIINNDSLAVAKQKVYY